MDSLQGKGLQMVDSDSQRESFCAKPHLAGLRQKVTLKAQSLLYVQVRVHVPNTILMASVAMSGFPF